MKMPDKVEKVNFKKSHIFYCFGAVLPKISKHSPSAVYGSIKVTFFVDSGIFCTSGSTAKTMLVFL